VGGCQNNTFYLLINGGKPKVVNILYGGKPKVVNILYILA
jgi:hypothetical protein